MGPASLRHNRAYVLLMAARALSAFGTQASFVSIPVLVLSESGRAPLVGIVAFTEGVAATAVFPFTGIVADRCGHRRVMLTSSLLGAVAMLTLAVTLLTHHAPIPVIFATVIVVSASGVFLPAAASAMVRVVVPREDLTRAVSANQARAAIAGITGPLAGAVLYEVSHALPFAVDGLSYLAAACCVARIRVRAAPRPPATGVVRDAAAGMTLVLRDSFLRYMLLTNAVVDFAFSGAIIVLVTAYSSGGTARGNSVIFAVAGGANLVGAVLAPAVVRTLPQRTIYLTILSAIGALVALMAAVHAVGWAGLLIGGCCVTVPVISIATQTSSLNIVPEHLAGRVQAVYQVVPQLATSAGALAAGLLERALPGSAILAVCAAPIAACAVWAAFTPALHSRAPREPDVSPASMAGPAGR